MSKQSLLKTNHDPARPHILGVGQETVNHGYNNNCIVLVPELTTTLIAPRCEYKREG